MIRTRDPRIRQRINQISHDIQAANQSTQEGLYTFSTNYISPCLASLSSCISSCTAPCLSHDGQIRRQRGYTEAEANFDFYDDWHTAEEEDSLLGWNAGELDRLLAGNRTSRTATEQPRRPRRMSYGTRNTKQNMPRLYIPDHTSDPTVIPSSSRIGFLERFPWRFGAKGVKYHPSAAGLQEHPGSHRLDVNEGEGESESEPLMGAVADGGQVSFHNNGKEPHPNGGGSGTASLGGASSLLSPRGDLFQSDEEEEDAVPLDDEFAFAFARRESGLGSDDQASKAGTVRSATSTSSLGDASTRKTEPFPPFPLPESHDTSSSPAV
ncbi:hypothetical protein N7478_008575 [Penicillium angulare]|uniref:uncharacterized protein n=1 Tax=Penicillium angulare TaxID=116970 RepID=UPI0025411954|nr:uncharacterized protein N7478_008575 [Penicillium angulare]KAJ5273450.1 hypothetical protein N7478_008575 [Penicillium angulare]